MSHVSFHFRKGRLFHVGPLEPRVCESAQRYKVHIDDPGPPAAPAPAHCRRHPPKQNLFPFFGLMGLAPLCLCS